MLHRGACLPSLEGATSWIGPEIRTAELVGHPTLVQFWALSCPLCKEQLPTILRLRETWGPKGLRLVSIHMPREPRDVDPEAVAREVLAQRLGPSVAIDDAHVLGDRFETAGLWPAYFLFGPEGTLRARAAGAYGPYLLERTLESLQRDAA